MQAHLMTKPANSPTRDSTPPPPASRRTIYALASIIVLAGLAAYSNSLSGPFLFDDTSTITYNTSLRDLWDLPSVLSPPGHGETVTARPVLNLSFAINYALGGLQPWGYHAGNLLICLLAGLTLFGTVRRTFLRPVLFARFGACALPLAFFCALLWTVHPLLTESVTFISQRAESLMGLFYLLTLYAFIRSVESSHPRCWSALSIIACLLGMASKEVIVSAPLMVFLYDRTFVAGTFQAAWRQRWRYYLALAATELLLVALVVNEGGNRGDNLAGFDAGMPWWQYSLLQCRSVVLYLKLAFWPHPLVFDYGASFPLVHPASVFPQGLLLVALLLGTGWALWRSPPLGFLGAWFFLILAPSSSILPLLGQAAAEHRMYLSLAAVLVVMVTALYVLLGRRSWPVFGLLAVVFGALTFLRNADYASPLKLYTATVADCPDNPRMRINLSQTLLQLQRPTEARDQALEALRLDPNYPKAYLSLANILLQLGQTDEALANYQQALRLSPGAADIHNDYAVALDDLGRSAEAIPEHRKALLLNPVSALFHFNLANTYMHAGRLNDALPEYQEAVRLMPDLADVQLNLGVALASLGRFADAVPHFRESLRLQPDNAGAHCNLADMLLWLGRPDQAIPEYEAALRLQPNFPAALGNLAIARQHAAANSAPTNP
jgi:tetratricopeptide (TPR) repeat protein